MNIPVRITYREMSPSPALEARIHEELARLQRHADPFMSCRVAVEAPSTRRRHGGVFRVHLDLGLPGKEIVVGGRPGERAEHADPFLAVRDAFRTARRAIEEHLRIRRHQVERHEQPAA